MVTRRALIVSGCGAFAASVQVSPAFAGDEPYDVGRDDPDRKPILDAIRPRVESEMRGPVEFVVRSIRAQGGFAFAVLDPQRPGGKPISPAETGHADAAEFMDGLTVYALVLWSNDRWNLVDAVTGPTDVAYEPWPAIYGAPPAIFGF